VDARPGQIEVLEFFAYTCIHCHQFVPVFKEWSKTVGPDVVIRHVPVGFNASFEPMQRLYYTLQAMGRVESHHERVFKAIHVDRQRLDTPDAMAQWAERNGLDKTQFTQVFNSFATAGRARRATQLQDAYEVEATPSVGVAGRFIIGGQAARTVLVANALINEVRRA
jgi:thiol:disulfide interchange protein DsbA